MKIFLSFFLLYIKTNKDIFYKFFLYIKTNKNCFIKFFSINKYGE